jgi:hypothetical protein
MQMNKKQKQKLKFQRLKKQKEKYHNLLVETVGKKIDTILETLK